MIEQIIIKNFKSYNDTILELAPLTLLIGANASGKSNGIEAIRLLSWLAHGRRLDDILQGVQQTDVNIRGTLADLIFDQSQSPVFTLGGAFSNMGEWKNFSISIEIESEKKLRIIDERVTSDNQTLPLYWIKEASPTYSHEVQVAFNNFSRGGVKPTIPCTDQQAIFTQLDVPSRFDVTKAKEPREVIPEVARKLQHAFKQIIFLDPIPRHMAGYSFISDDQLREDGANVSSILYNLCQKPAYKDKILRFIQSLPEQEIVDIKFIETPRREVMVQLEESFGQRKVIREAPLLSDGTLRVLAIAAALLSAAEGSLLIIEEVDNGIHPSRANMILNNIQKIARQRALHVLLTSHNPALLDSLPDEAIPNVVACYRDPQQGDSRLIRLANLLDYPELLAQGPLGQLMTQGVIDRYLKSQQSPEQKRLEARQWFNLFRQQVEVENA